MLQITANTIKGKIAADRYPALRQAEQRTTRRSMIRVFTIVFLLLGGSMFLPWTQNIQSRGVVTALRPDQRPQTIHSVIPGRIEKWFVQEGDRVKKGDTILFISETKDDYFDPLLVDRTGDQLKNKELSVDAYMGKVKALDTQIDAMLQARELKKEQAENKLKQAFLKIASDSIDLVALKTNYDIATEQYKRFETLYKDGLKSLTDLEGRKQKMQEALAKMMAQENKLLTSRNEAINARVDLSSINADYSDKISKSESEKYSAISNMYDAEIAVTKLQNQVMNYTVRTGMYYITAPQDGYITKAIRSGIGETIKEGTPVVSIMPASYELAVEMYVDPIDVPLLTKGQPVRVQFDGWPAIVFSGWPNASYGTYGGTVAAIDNFISDNGKYRVLVAPDRNDLPWPQPIRLGAGTQTITLLNDVPVWYELWRKTNGFPADYYTGTKSNPDKTEDKK
jgi:multidrug resistance efflux pump